MKISGFRMFSGLREYEVRSNPYLTLDLVYVVKKKGRKHQCQILIRMIGIRTAKILKI